MQDDERPARAGVARGPHEPLQSPVVPPAELDYDGRHPGPSCCGVGVANAHNIEGSSRDLAQKVPRNQPAPSLLIARGYFATEPRSTTHPSGGSCQRLTPQASCGPMTCSTCGEDERQAHRAVFNWRKRRDSITRRRECANGHAWHLPLVIKSVESVPCDCPRHD